MRPKAMCVYCTLYVYVSIVYDVLKSAKIVALQKPYCCNFIFNTFSISVLFFRDKFNERTKRRRWTNGAALLQVHVLFRGRVRKAQFVPQKREREMGQSRPTRVAIEGQ